MHHAAAEAEDAPPRPSAAKARAGRAVALTPDLVAPVVATFGALGVASLLLGAPQPAALVVATVVAVAVGVLTGRRLWPSVDAARADVVASSGVLVLAAGWAAFTAAHVGQWFIVDRDPGFYSVASRYLSDAGSYPLQTHAAAVTSGVPGVVDWGAGFYPAGPGEIYVQGGPLLPVLLGDAQRLFGSHALTLGNVALGALALVALFAWARRLVPPLWALLPSAALALSLPLLYVTRGTFSEVPALVVVAGGLALLTRGFADTSPGLAALGAATASTATLGRIDGVAMVGVAVAASAGLWVVVATRRPGMRLTAAAALVSMLAVTLPSLWVYSVVSPQYLDDLWPEVHLSLLGLGAATVAAALLVALWPRVQDLVATRAPDLGVLVARTVAGLGALALVVLASRPLWTVAHVPADPGNLAQGSVAGLQKALGMAVDRGRTYDEYTVVSTAWYFGWPVLVLSVVGLLVYALVVRRGLLSSWAPALGALVTLVPLYFTAWHNTPDQLWSSRRLVGLGYPLLLLLATFALSSIVASRRVRALAPAARALVAAGAVALVLVPTLATTRPLATVGQYRGVSSVVARTCQAIAARATAERPAVVIVTGPSAAMYVTTVGVFCSVPSVMPSPPLNGAPATNPRLATAQVASWAAAHGMTAVRVDFEVSTRPTAIAGATVISRAVPKYQRTLIGAPSTAPSVTLWVSVSTLG